MQLPIGRGEPARFQGGSVDHGAGLGRQLFEAAGLIGTAALLRGLYRDLIPFGECLDLFRQLGHPDIREQAWASTVRAAFPIEGNGIATVLACSAHHKPESSATTAGVVL